MSGEILFLAHRLPLPPDRGDKIRSHHVLKALAALAPVHVGCLAEEGDYAHKARLAELAASWSMPRRPRSLALAGMSALRRGKPVSLAAFRSAELARWVERTLRTRPISAIYVFSGQMGQYVPADWQGRLVVDLVDVDSAKFEAYAQHRRGPRGWIDAREGRLLREVERLLVERADATLLVSEEEAQLLRSRTGAERSGQGTIRALRNGIDAASFDPALVAPHPELAESAGPHFVFTGQMDYSPNVAAVSRFVARNLPAIQARHSRAQFHVVGRSPSREVLALARHRGVRVWGAVPDVRPFLAAAELVVAPLTLARGVQNKVLEAMAMGRCVLLSPEAATGIDARHGEHFSVAESDAAMIAQACELLARPGEREAIGKAARALVRERMSWPAALADLPEIMGLRSGNAGRRDAA